MKQLLQYNTSFLEVFLLYYYDMYLGDYLRMEYMI